MIGGLKNAIERGESISNAQRSFINAGYSSQEVMAAAQKVSGGNFAPKQSPGQYYQTPSSFSTQYGGESSFEQSETKHTLKKTIWIIIISGALVFVAAGILGLFWDQLF
ncbi:MAG: hypothetical protein NUV97_02990 [archaeon]|nr:hypothetical protein [archaeon]MCR4324037.1 hypothetical protein [Nanoarchaeota archaeon]